jgi:hypothetical protein
MALLQDCAKFLPLLRISMNASRQITVFSIACTPAGD